MKFRASGRAEISSPRREGSRTVQRVREWVGVISRPTLRAMSASRQRLPVVALGSGRATSDG